MKVYRFPVDAQSCTIEHTIEHKTSTIGRKSVLVSTPAKQLVTTQLLVTKHLNTVE